MASRSAAEELAAGTIKALDPVPALTSDDAATYQYLGHAVPRSNFENKAGSYWGTMLGVARGPASIVAATAISCAFSGWDPAALASGTTLCVCATFLDILWVPTPVMKLLHRSSSILERHGRTIFLLYLLATAGYFISNAAWMVLLLLRPINGQVIWTTLLLAVQKLVGLYSPVCSEISRQDPDRKQLRLQRMGLMAAAWLEFSTDIASGIVACQNGLGWLGGPIVAAGFVEYGLIIAHTISGITEYSPTLLGLHALLEIPVLALTGTVLTAQHSATFRSRLPHITSIAQTFTCLLLHALWMLYLRHTRSQASGATVAPASAQQEEVGLEV